MAAQYLYNNDVTYDGREGGREGGRREGGMGGMTVIHIILMAAPGVSLEFHVAGITTVVGGTL